MADISTLPSESQSAPPGNFENFDYNKIPEGGKFTAPDGTVRQKPFTVKDDAGYGSVPEGAHFVDPEGKLRVKPSYEEISAPAQSVFSQAINQKEQLNALSHFYGKDSVKQDTDGNFYVEQPNGKRLKPKKGWSWGSAGAFALENAAPITMSGAGSIAGGLFGGAIGGPPGAFLGAAGGAYLGSAAGQVYNDMMLALSGVYDRTLPEEAEKITEMGKYGATGEAVGAVGGKLLKGALDKGLKAIPEGVKETGAAVAEKFQPVIAPVLRKILGVKLGNEDVSTAIGLAGNDVPSPVESWAPGAFMPKKIQQWAKQISGFDPVKESGETYYNSSAGRVLKDIGVTPEQAPTRSTAAVSSENAGKSVLATTRKEIVESDLALQKAHDEALRATGVVPDEIKASTVRGLQEAIDNNERVAQKAIDQSWADIETTRMQMLDAANIGNNPGDLSRAMADKIVSVRKAVGARSRIMYTAGDALAGDAKLNMIPAVQDANAFLKSAPEGFAGKYPEEIALIFKMVEGEGLTFGQGHQLRSFLRHGIDWQDLTPDFRTGALKKLQYTINNVLHDGEAAPELQAAAKALDKTDAYYARNMGAFNDAKIQNLVDLTESGLPPNPSVIARNVMEQEGGWTERMTKLRRLVGPDNWKAVQAADLQNMLDASKTLAPGQINGSKFADQILKRYQSGVLNNGYDSGVSKQLLEQAQRIAIKGGTLDFKVLPGDTVSEAMARISAAQAKIDAIVAKDPYSVLSSEVKKLEAQHVARVAETKAIRSTEPLSFLNDSSALAMASADKILGKPDLMKAAAIKFGPDSPEFAMLRQVAAQRLFQRSLGKVGDLGKDFANYTRDVQELIFPNGLDQSVLKLSREMKAIFPHSDDDFGGSLAGAALGIRPKSAVEKVLKAKLVGPQWLYRVGVSEALERASAFFSNPRLILYVAGRPQRLTQAETNILSEQALQYMKYGGNVGAMAAPVINNNKNQVPASQKKSKDWRELYKQKYGEP